LQLKIIFICFSKILINTNYQLCILEAVFSLLKLRAHSELHVDSEVNKINHWMMNFHHKGFNA